MEKLQDLTQSELQDLLDNSERVESMALESDEIQNIQLEREMALAANRSLAEQNLDMKPRLETERSRLVEKYTELEAVREKYKQHCVLRDSIMGQVSPEALLSRLQIEGDNTEEESETLANEFLEGSITLDSFLERFLSLRSLTHTRRIRIEKLQEILSQKSKGISDTAMTSQPCANQDAGSSSSSSPWQQQQPQQQQSSKMNPPSNASSSALPYSPYPVVPPPNHPPSATAAGPTNSSTAFQPYPSQGAPYPATTGYPGPALGPPVCPYPTQPSQFPGPPFGQFGPAPAPFPRPYTYGGYAYPTGPHGPSTQSPTGRPLHRPGFGVPQQYS